MLQRLPGGLLLVLVPVRPLAAVPDERLLPEGGIQRQDVAPFAREALERRGRGAGQNRPVRQNEQVKTRRA